MSYLVNKLLEKVFSNKEIERKHKSKLTLKSNLELPDSEDKYLVDIHKQINSVKSKVVFQKIKVKEKPHDINYTNLYFDARLKKWNNKCLDSEESAQLYLNFDKMKQRNDHSEGANSSKSNSSHYLTPCLTKVSKHQERRMKIKSKLRKLISKDR